MDIIITKHAYDRMKERFKYNKSAVDKIAKKAYENGIKHSDTTGQLNKYVSGRTYEYKQKGTNIIIYGEIVYVFIDEPQNDLTKLITTFQIPKTLKNSAIGKQSQKQLRRKS